jgi:hypothetical protein
MKDLRDIGIGIAFVGGFAATTLVAIYGDKMQNLAWLLAFIVSISLLTYVSARGRYE